MESSKTKKIAIGAIIVIFFVLIIWAYFAFREPKKATEIGETKPDTLDIEHTEVTSLIEAKQRFEEMPNAVQNELRQSFFKEISEGTTQESFDEYLVSKIQPVQKTESNTSENIETDLTENKLVETNTTARYVSPLQKFFTEPTQQVKPDAKTLKIDITVKK